MASEFDCYWVEQAIGYHFKNQKLLMEALTAAGADGEGHDGNRHLASVGRAALQLAIADSGYMKLMPPGLTGEVQIIFESKDQLALAATQLGITSHIKLCKRSGDPSKHVITLAMRAIIGAVWKDTGSLATVGGLVQRLDPILNRHQDPSTIPASPVIQPSNNPVSDSEALSLDALPTDALPTDVLPTDALPTDALSAFPYASIDLTGLEYVGAVGEPVAAQDTMQHHLPLIHDPNALQGDLFDVTVPPELPTVAIGDMAIAIDPANWVAASASNTSAGPTSTSRKRTFSDSNVFDSVSAAVEMDLCSGKQTRIDGTGSDGKAFHDYMALEARRCKEHGVHEPDSTFLEQTTLDEVMCIERGSSSFIRMLVGLGSASSIATLRATLASMRDYVASPQPPAANLSAPERLNAIEVSEGQISSLTMLKRCHVLKFWEDHRSHHNSQDNWITVRMASESTPKRPGNPQNYEKSLATRATVEGVFPEVAGRSQGYASKRNKVKRLLSLGQKLSMLRQRFGIGILGLISCESDTTKASFPDISDRILDRGLQKFLPILDRSQGSLLRELGEAASPIVQNIMCGTVKGSQIFRLELVEPADILKLPKGSRELLAMLSESV